MGFAKMRAETYGAANNGMVTEGQMLEVVSLRIFEMTKDLAGGFCGQLCEAMAHRVMANLLFADLAKAGLSVDSALELHELAMKMTEWARAALEAANAPAPPGKEEHGGETAAGSRFPPKPAPAVPDWVEGAGKWGDTRVPAGPSNAAFKDGMVVLIKGNSEGHEIHARGMVARQPYDDEGEVSVSLGDIPRTFTWNGTVWCREDMHIAEVLL